MDGYSEMLSKPQLGNPDDKKRIAADVLPEIRRIADPIVRDH